MAVITEGKHPFEHVLWEEEAAYSRETVTLIANAGALVPGTVLGKVTASGNYKAYAAGNSDGSQTAAAILAYPASNSTATQTVVVHVRSAVVKGAALTGADTAAKTALTNLGILVR